MQPTRVRPKAEDASGEGCFGISGVVIGSALSKGWRSGPEAFRAGHFLRPKPENAHEKSLAPRVQKPTFGGKRATKSTTAGTCSHREAHSSCILVSSVYFILCFLYFLTSELSSVTRE